MTELTGLAIVVSAFPSEPMEGQVTTDAGQTPTGRSVQSLFPPRSVSSFDKL